MKFLCDRIRSYGCNKPAITDEGLLKTAWECSITLTDVEWAWVNGLFTKVCLQVSSEAELLDIHRRAQDAGLISSLIQDAGQTEFGGVPTYTCCAIGPDTAEKIDPITGGLALY